jgi:hypothetical protein
MAQTISALSIDLTKLVFHIVGALLHKSTGSGDGPLNSAVS